MATAIEIEPPVASEQVRADGLASSVVILLGMTVLQRLIGFGRGVLFCRLLDPEQLGQWDVAFSFLNLAAPLAVLGLPGSFGRYFEYYRSRQQLRTFLRRTTLMCTLTGLAAVAAIAIWRQQFSELIFGRDDRGELVLWLTACLAAVIVQNFLVCIFMAARRYRAVTAVQFLQSLLFAAISVALCYGWQKTAASAVAGYGVVGADLRGRVVPAGAARMGRAAHEPAISAGRRQFWSKLLPFAGWVWVTNLLTNLFDIVDRYMIVHYSGMNVDDALRQVGYYHSSRLIPLLIVALAALLGTMVTPHLSHDWEAGRRRAVATQLNTILKNLLLALLTGSVAVLAIAPLLFNFALAGKFTAGLDQLPLTLAYCTWFGTIAVAQNYLWCAEKAWLSSCSLLVGLVVNVALDLVLLQRFGLHGAVMATTAANFVALSLVYLFSWHYGMHIDRGTWLLSVSPCLLWFGPWVAGLALVALWIAAVTTPLLFNRAEKLHSLEVARGFLARFANLTGWHWPRGPIGTGAGCLSTIPSACFALNQTSPTHPPTILPASPAMFFRRSKLIPLADRGPLRVMFALTSMPVGGAETLLVNLIRRLDRNHFLPELCCLKELGPLGEELSAEVPTFSNLIHRKTDLGVVGRLARLLRQRRIDALITVGAGDKMFWGRLAAWRAGLPVVASALHSTGWPDGVGRLNRMLTPITDAFIAVAQAHGEYLVEHERFPRSKVWVIPNGVDVDRFDTGSERAAARAELGIAPATPVAGIVAALRPEKNHELLLRAAAQVRRQVPSAEFLIVGDGPLRPGLEALAAELGLKQAVRFLGTRSDIPRLLAAMDAFVLTSKMEANPVSILEAMATSRPVVAPNVGSIAESVADGVTGYLTTEGSAEETAARLCQLFTDPELAHTMGRRGRQRVVQHWSLDVMVRGYERLIREIYVAKSTPGKSGRPAGADEAEPQLIETP